MGLTYTLEYSNNSNFYSLELEISDAKIFGEKQAKLQAEGKKDEALVAALIADNEAGMVRSVKRYKNYYGRPAVSKYSYLSDGPNGEPASMTFWSNGNPKTIQRFHNDGTAGTVNFHSPSDGRNGEPSSMEFWENGNLKTVQRRRNDKLEDSPTGEHAIQHFTAKGEPAYSFSYKGGVRSDAEKEELARWPTNADDFNRVAASRIAALEKALRELQEKQQPRKAGKKNNGAATPKN